MVIAATRGSDAGISLSAADGVLSRTSVDVAVQAGLHLSVIATCSGGSSRTAFRSSLTRLLTDEVWGARRGAEWARRWLSRAGWCCRRRRRCMYALRTAVRGGWRPQFAVGGAISDAWDSSYRAAAAAYSYTPTTSLSGASAPPTIGPLSASTNLSGTRLGFDRDGFLRMLDGRIDVHISAENDYQASSGRARRG